MGGQKKGKSPIKSVATKNGKKSKKVPNNKVKKANAHNSTPPQSPPRAQPSPPAPSAPNTPPFDAATQPLSTEKRFVPLRMGLSESDAAFHASEIANFLQMRPTEHDFRPLKSTPAYRDKEGSKQLWCAHSACKSRATEYCIQCSYRNFAPKIIPVCKTCQSQHKQPGGVLTK